MVGLIAGATEVLMEKASIDSLFSLKTPNATRGFVRNVLKQAGIESTEEGLTNIVNTIADDLIMRDKSELETIKRQLMANGASRREAELAAIQAWSKEFALDVAGGFLSGGTFGSLKSGADYIGTTLLQQNNTAPGSNRSDIKTDDREETSYGEGVHLRDGGQRSGGQNSGGEVSAVETGTGRDQNRQSQVESADRGAASLSYGPEVSTADLGIRGGSTEANIQIVNSGETVATRAAMNIAQENGLELTLFAGGNLQINNASGKTDSVRGYIEGNRVYVRADHPVYTAEQLMRHEVGHAQIARGEINPKTVRQRITKTYGIGHTVQLSMLYAAAYEGSGMSGGEIWEEVICDSLGDMNIFRGYNVEEQAGRLLNEVRESVEAETRLDRGPPAADLDVVGRMSKEKWWPDLTKSQMADLRQWVKRDIRTSENSICETANWTFRSFNGLPVFAIYSTVNESEPTILYESKGAQAELERECLKNYLEEFCYGGDIYGKPEAIDQISGSSGVRQVGGAGNNNGTVGRGGSSGNAGVLQKQSRRKPSAAFKSVIRNLLEVRETGTAGKRSRELDMMHIATAENGRLNRADEEYLAFIRQLEEVQVRLKAEELRQAYLRNMARLEEAEREAEMDVAFWKYWD